MMILTLRNLETKVIYMYIEKNFGMEKNNNLISMHDCARLDMGS